ncbi:uncharacterized protein LOC101206083 isoform X1 [Cucumis sativus]|uniref:Embryonic stem cell-specific 5-hydroxymethylcytosine-binding protein n=1 Tax=Cucumis sativus TaxID=3659 RepID=A0A0A0K6X8_CUCSA|nr:uncharacterized protein LOC101206083 isoform X1 [Cucumis sativus]KGN44679.1 hypothetical protein Csa_015996 [Cucumis sativus]
MCGRARCTLRADDITRACHRTGGPVRSLNMDRFRPLFNASPGSDLPVVRRDDESSDGGVVLQCMKWGLIPSFTEKFEKPNYFKMFNARSESIHEKASFHRLVPKRRCLVAVEGFYEWKKDGSKKQPYYIHFKDGQPLALAALYDCWENLEGELLYTFTILTTSSSPALKWLHDRMPVILGDKERMDMWLNDSSSSKYDSVLKPYEAPDLVWYPVTPSMGKPSFDGPDCIKEIQLKNDGSNLISKFFSAKETKKEYSVSQEKTCSNTSVKPEASPSLEEHKREVNRGASSEESKDCLAKCSSDTSLTYQIKRDREDISSDLKSGMDDYSKVGSSPKIRKKGNLKTGNDNQLTLFSYFGKK